MSASSHTSRPRCGAPACPGSTRTSRRRRPARPAPSRPLQSPAPVYISAPPPRPAHAPAHASTEPRIPSALSMRGAGTPTPRPSPAPQLFSNKCIRPRPRPCCAQLTRPATPRPVSRPSLHPSGHRQPALGTDPAPKSPSLRSASLSSSDSESDSDGRLVRRLPAFLKKQRVGANSSGSEGVSDGEDEPAFLPLSAGRDASATVTLPPRTNGALDDTRRPGNVDTPQRQSSAHASSAGPSSPSMGSSFSDLSGRLAVPHTNSKDANWKGQTRA